jgi:hypothetical protein
MHPVTWNSEIRGSLVGQSHQSADTGSPHWPGRTEPTVTRGHVALCIARTLAMPQSAAKWTVQHCPSDGTRLANCGAHVSARIATHRSATMPLQCSSNRKRYRRTPGQPPNNVVRQPAGGHWAALGLELRFMPPCFMSRLTQICSMGLELRAGLIPTGEF